MKFEKFPFKMEKQFRLKNWDYSSSGFYFITICTHNHINYFGEIKNNKIKLNQIGKIAFQNWTDIPNHFPGISLDEFIIMPDHIHGILIIKNNFSPKNNELNQNTTVGTHYNAFLPWCINNSICRNMPWHVPTDENNVYANKNDIYFDKLKNQFSKPISNSISIVLNHFKGSITKFCHQNNIKFKWQPRFHDRIIRSEKEFYAKIQYIKDNPKN